MKARDLKGTRTAARKPETKKRVSTKKGITSPPKTGKAVSRPATSKSAAKTAKPGRKALLKKPAVAKKTSADAKKRGAEKKPSDETRKLVTLSAVKPSKTMKKPAVAKVPAPAKKSSQEKAGKNPAPAGAKSKATGKKLQKPASKEPAAKKIAAKVSAALVKKIGMKVKGPSSKKIAAAEKPARKAKKASAAKVEKTLVKAKSLSLKTAEKGKQKTPAKAVAENVVSSKLSVRAGRKPAAPLKPEEKELQPSPKKKTVTKRVAVKPVEEKKSITPKAPALKKTGPVVSGIAGAKGKTPIRKTVGAEKGKVIPAKISTKTATALKKPAGKKSAVALLPVKPHRAKLKIFLPGPEAGEEDIQEGFISGLPEEYGENAIIAMVVDPNTVFVDWEVVPREIAGKEGDLMLRFYDVTGTRFDGNNAHAILDVSITQRVGSGFFAICMPGRDVIVEAGIVRPDGSFHGVVRSDVVSFPFLLTFDDLGILQGLFATDIPVGY